MSRFLVVELNDCDLRVGGDPSLAAGKVSPGWAVFEPNGEAIRVGAEAAEQIRLHPRLAHRGIWSELGLEPLPRPFPRGLSTADLAYAHLRSIWEAAERRLGGRAAKLEGRLLAAPGSFSVDQLGLVLGIAESLDRPFTGVVDSAVAAASAGVGEPCVVLDLELGRAVGSIVGTKDGGVLARAGVRSQQGAGWNALLDAWARAIGRAFVTRTRYDPLHAAHSEQRLYSALPGWLAALGERETAEVSMPAGDREHTLVLTRQELEAAAEPIYARIVELARSLAESGGEVAVTVTDRLARAPGLASRLEAAGLGAPRRLEADAALDGALRAATAIHAPGERSPRWVTELPARPAAAVTGGAE